jgi:DNA mismatch repair ATPase MutL
MVQDETVQILSVGYRGQALASVRAGIRRELINNQHVDSKAREYNASASYDHKSGLQRGDG